MTGERLLTDTEMRLLAHQTWEDPKAYLEMLRVAQDAQTLKAIRQKVEGIKNPYNPERQHLSWDVWSEAIQAVRELLEEEK